MKIMSVIGARPEFIKAGPVTRAFAETGIQEVIVHTGQHYDPEMSKIFFEALGLRQPDKFLGVGSGTHGHQTGLMLDSIERLMFESMPDAMLVYGDTNSTLAGALAAVKLHVPVIHVEAGLRSFNRRMPEEINRIITDHISSLLFCPTETAVTNLISEGVKDGVHQVGDVNQDALDYWRTSGEGRTGIINKLGLTSGSYCTSTIHRAENVDNAACLTGILQALDALDQPVVLPLHPRTAKALDGLGKELYENIRFIPPVGFLEMLELIDGSSVILTDSGGVQKEAYMLGVPCVTLRTETEWVETVTAGWNTIAGTGTESIVNAVKSISPPASRPAIFGDGTASRQIAAIAFDVLTV